MAKIVPSGSDWDGVARKDNVWYMIPGSQDGTTDGRIATIAEAAEIAASTLSLSGDDVITSANASKCIIQNKLATYGCTLYPGVTYDSTQCVKYSDIVSNSLRRINFNIIPYATNVNNATSKIVLSQGQISIGDYTICDLTGNTSSTTITGNWVWGKVGHSLAFTYKDIGDRTLASEASTGTYKRFFPAVTVSREVITSSGTAYSQRYSSEWTDGSTCTENTYICPLRKGLYQVVRYDHDGHALLQNLEDYSGSYSGSIVQSVTYTVTISFKYTEVSVCTPAAKLFRIKYRAPQQVGLTTPKQKNGIADFVYQGTTFADGVGYWIYASNTEDIPTTVNDYAFSGLSTVTEIDLCTLKHTTCSVTTADTLKTLGKSTFYNCPKLEKVILPTEVKIIPDYCFHSCTNLHRIQQKETKTDSTYRELIFKTNADDGASLIIGSDSNYYQSQAPSKITNIGTSAFSHVALDPTWGGGWGLNASNVTVLRTAALADSYFDKIIVNSALISIPDRCCKDCIYLSQFATTLSTIDSDCTCYVQIPGAVTTIGEEAFCGASNQTYMWGWAKVTQNTSYVTVDNATAKYYRTVQLPASVKKIGTKAFSFYAGYTSLFGSNSYDQMWYLTSRDIDDIQKRYEITRNCVTHKVYYAGTIAQYLQITFGTDWIERYWSLSCNGTTTTSVTVGSTATTTSIAEVFKNTTHAANSSDTLQAKSINVHVPANAFEYCLSITSLVINGTNVNIGQNAFKDCMCLTKMSGTGTINIICSDAFCGCVYLNPSQLRPIKQIDTYGLYAIGGQTGNGMGFESTAQFDTLQQIGWYGIHILCNQHRNHDVTLKFPALRIAFRYAISMSPWNQHHRETENVSQADIYIMVDDPFTNLRYAVNQSNYALQSSDGVYYFITGQDKKTDVHLITNLKGNNFYVPTAYYDAYFNTKNGFLYTVSGTNRRKY